MFIGRSFSWKAVLQFSGFHALWLTVWGACCVAVYVFTGAGWMALPWLPVSLVGTAVAFYVGFKNNSSYDRMWEARKIWGAIVNDSRAYGSTSRHYITALFSKEKLGDRELHTIHTRILHRHIAWLYMLREQLLVPAPWEHMHEDTNVHIRRVNVRRIKTFGLGVLDDRSFADEMKLLLPQEEWNTLQQKGNKATHLLDNQSKELKELRKLDLIDDFRHMELQNIINRLYEHQGKCERIKNYPLPRQYAGSSNIFVSIFIILLPFGMLGEFNKMGEGMIWLTIPFVTIVGWVFLMMELIGDYSENPFEGLGNDIPMMSLCRNIEIDLREMLGEQDLPSKVQAVNQVLM
ncbi:MAG TPA: hypothetical protein DHW15_01455 [Bacteroidetes bacterium]|jgi:ion channel-forming bestrophin family protein|nr:MAG: hypothetical protein ABR94_10550 [Sphingobacteriales bacterium BACL12 MAG-120802-bin5]KRP10533.1 MAG: hypothetical protein ABR95_08185 [Sphingobacteriales bacterium BACL12 MAG-120813-bin55]HCK20858.1 hypothetical protein [Bacteroidota bacterium]